MQPIFLDLGIIKIYWYSLTMFLGILIGGSLAINEAKKYLIDEDFMINMFFYLIPFSLIGARLYYVIFNWSYYQNNIMEIFRVWEGGLAIHGSIIVGIIWIIFYSKKNKVNTLRLMDIVVVGLLIGQAIGRWGNFFNGEAHGPATTLTFLKSLILPQFIIDGMYINGVYYQPTFLYESIWCLIGFVLILIIRRFKYIKIGQPTAFYLVWYGIGRFFIESLRTDSLMFNSFKMAQLISIIMIISGVVLYFVCNRGSRFERLYNDRSDISNENV